MIEAVKAEAGIDTTRAALSTPSDLAKNATSAIAAELNGA